MDYPSGKFSDFSFSRFGFIVRTDRQTDKQTHTPPPRETDRYTHATTIGVSNSVVIITVIIIIIIRVITITVCYIQRKANDEIATAFVTAADERGRRAAGIDCTTCGQA